MDNSTLLQLVSTIGCSLLGQAHSHFSQPVRPLQNVFTQKILQGFIFLQINPNQFDLPLFDNRDIIKANVFSNRLVCVTDREHTICPVPGREMTPAAVTFSTQEHFSVFSHGM